MTRRRFLFLFVLTVLVGLTFAVWIVRDSTPRIGLHTFNQTVRTPKIKLNEIEKIIGAPPGEYGAKHDEQRIMGGHTIHDRSIP